MHLFRPEDNFQCGNLTVATSIKGKQLCEIWDSKKNQKEEYDQAKTDGQLMATAPELLEACQKLVSELEQLRFHVSDMGYIEWEPEENQGCKDVDEAINQGKTALQRAIK